MDRGPRVDCRWSGARALFESTGDSTFGDASDHRRQAGAVACQPERMPTIPRCRDAETVSRSSEKSLIPTCGASSCTLGLGPGQPNPLVRSTRGDSQPSFSPDGKRIAFQSNRSGSFEIWLSSADGSNQVQLTSLNGPPAVVAPLVSRRPTHCLLVLGNVRHSCRRWSPEPIQRARKGRRATRLVDRWPVALFHGRYRCVEGSCARGKSRPGHDERRILPSSIAGRPTPLLYEGASRVSGAFLCRVARRRS